MSHLSWIKYSRRRGINLDFMFRGPKENQDYKDFFRDGDTFSVLPQGGKWPVLKVRFEKKILRRPKLIVRLYSDEFREELERRGQ